MHGIVLTDSAASSTVRQDLRNALPHIGDGTDHRASSIIRLIEDKIGRSALKDRSVFKRLHVEILTFGRNGEHELLARQMLEPILPSKAHAFAAWDILVRHALGLMVGTGGRSTTSDPADLDKLLRTLRPPLTLIGSSVTQTSAVAQTQPTIITPVGSRHLPQSGTGAELIVDVMALDGKRDLLSNVLLKRADDRTLSEPRSLDTVKAILAQQPSLRILWPETDKDWKQTEDGVVAEVEASYKNAPRYLALSLEGNGHGQLKCTPVGENYSPTKRRRKGGDRETYAPITDDTDANVIHVIQEMERARNFDLNDAYKGTFFFHIDLVAALTACLLGGQVLILL